MEGAVTYTITASASSDNGTITPEGRTTVTQGSGIQYKITPKSGYTISAVYVDGTPVGAVSSYNFTDVKGDHSISVDFAAIPGQESAPPKPAETAKPDNTDTETSPAPDKTQPEKKPEEQPKQPEPSKENGLTGTLKMLDISVEEAEKLIDEGNDRRSEERRVGKECRL